MIRISRRFQRFSPTDLFACLACALALLNAPAIHAQDSIVHFDKADAKIDFSLGSSLHTVHGTFSLKNSSIHFDPANGKISGFVAVDATSGESGNNSRDSRMHREIIESAKFPEIVFTPTQITGAVAPDGTSKVNISGRFSLHGKDHDVTFPVEVVAGGQKLQIAFHYEIPYVEWGLKSPSNFFLKASDKVDVDIHATGRMETASAAQ